MSTEQESIAQVSDAELFAAALDDDVQDKALAPEPEVQEEVTPQADAEPAPEATEEAPQQPPAEKQPEPPQGHQVPLSELLNTRERAQKAEREVEEFRRELAQLRQQMTSQAQPQQQRELPDPLHDPAGYAQYIQEQVEARAQHLRVSGSLQDAHEQHGEAFEAAFKAADQAIRQGDASLNDRIRNAANPGRFIMNWHKQQETLRETGGDITAYRERIIQEQRETLKNDPAFRAALIAEMRSQAASSNAPTANVTSLPPSLNRAPAAARQTVDTDAQMSDRELFQDAMRRR